MDKHIIVTGGAGYLGSVLVPSLLNQGYQVTVIDNLQFGGESLLPFLHHKGFKLVVENINNTKNIAEVLVGAYGIVHLAALVGFPACKRAGREMTWRVNVEGTKEVYDLSLKAGVKRFVFASSYSNYGYSEGDTIVTEESPLFPQSLYAETKIAAEQYLLGHKLQNSIITTCLRLATVFGVSPRTRFDLMVNQFVLEAFSKRRLVLYQEDFKRSFVHIRDVAYAFLCVLEAPEEKIRSQVFNIGSEKMNTTKLDIVKLIKNYWPDIKVELSDMSFDGDMRSLHVSFEKVKRILNFETQMDLISGITELCRVLENNIIQDPYNDRYRNHPALLL